MRVNIINKVFLMLMLMTLVSCEGRSHSSLTNNSDTIRSNKKTDSIKKDVNAERKMVSNTDSDAVAPPTQTEEREELVKEYDQISLIDSIFIDGGDTLHFHLKYRCLKSSSLLIPKHYDLNEKNPKDFETHPFVSDILLINKRDTVLNKQFKANDFYPFFKDNFGGGIKKYGSLDMPEFSKRNKEKKQITLLFTIAIPTTDLSVGLFLIISKDGSYKIVQADD